jgi:hypothetical protein
MTTEIKNLDQIRTNLSQQLITLEEELQLDTVSKENLQALLLATIQERQLLLNELDSLKSIQETLQLRIPHYSKFKSILFLSEIKENLYNDFQNFSIKLGRSTGEILTSLMAQFLSKFDEKRFPQLSASELVRRLSKTQPRIEVAHLENLHITDSDLEDVDLKVDFIQIDNLELNLSPEIFLSSIHHIKKCKIVKISSSIPRLLVYAKISQCNEIHFLPDDKACLDYVKEANQLVEDWKNE